MDRLYKEVKALTYQHHIFFSLMALISMSLIACSPKGEKSPSSGGGASVIRIQAPTINNISGQSFGPSGVNAFSGVTLCYGVSVQGPGIDTISNAPCTPPVGVFSGFVPSGGILSLAVPKGDNRKIDLYAYAIPAGSTESCPNFAVPIPTTRLGKTYLIGSTSGVELKLDDQEVTLSATLPAATDHVARQFNMSTACIAAADSATTNPSMNVVVSAGTVTGSGGYALKARVGLSAKSEVATGAGGLTLKKIR